MSKGWERFFFVLAYITQGSSYMSPRAYGIMHRLHHAHTDTELDPHSPSYDKNFFAMMWRTRNEYHGIFTGKTKIEERYLKHLPEWNWFDKWGNHTLSRLMWMALYIGFYLVFAPSAWWFILIPIHMAMGPIHGVIINWFAHKYGKTNFETDNTSRNLFKVDWLMFGEGYHNNHHKFPARSNFAAKRGEFDFCYPIIYLLRTCKVIKMNASHA